MTESEKYMVALVEQDLKKLEEFGKGDTIMSEYIEEARDVSSKTNLWQSYDKELALKEDAIMEGLEEGREKGLEEGRKEGIKEVSKSLLESGVDINTISKCTGLTIQEIKSL